MRPMTMDEVSELELDAASCVTVCDYSDVDPEVVELAQRVEWLRLNDPPGYVEVVVAMERLRDCHERTGGASGAVRQ
jgi:hypothetical protein